MTTFSANDVLTDARRLLVDSDGDRWSDPDLIAWLNEGQRKILTIDPTVLSARYSHTLSQGVRQELDEADYMFLLDVPFNLNNSGERGAAILVTDEKTMSLEDPNWATSTAQSTVLHWMPDSSNKKQLGFYVWPPQPDGETNTVEIEVTVQPTPATTGSGDLDFPIEYKQALVDYVVFRAFKQDMANETDDKEAANHFQLFVDHVKGLMK